MIVKKFIVDDMQEGMLLIRKTMGRDAMILSQRPVRGSGPFGLLKKKRLEVYAAAEEEAIDALQYENQRPSASSVSLNRAALNLKEIHQPVNRPPQQGQQALNRPPKQEQDRIDKLANLIEQMQKQSQMQNEPQPRQAMEAQGAEHTQMPDTGTPAAAAGTDQHVRPMQPVQPAQNTNTTSGEQQATVHQRLPLSAEQPENLEHLLRQIQRAAVQDQLQPQQPSTQSQPSQSLQPPEHLRQSRQAQQQSQQAQPSRSSHQAQLSSDGAGQSSDFMPDPLPGRRDPEQKTPLHLSAKQETAFSELSPVNTEQSQIRQKTYMGPGVHAPDLAAAATPDLNQPDTDMQEALLGVMYEKLLSADVHLQVANQLINQAADDSLYEDVSSEQILADLIQDCFSQDGLELKLKKGKQKKVMFAGPSGVGKTATLIKLATQLCRDQHLDIGIISADYQRAAAHLQIKAYADILGLSFYSLKSLSEAPGAKQEMSGKDLVLIDTPGCNPAFDEQATLAHQLMEIFTPDQLYVCLAAGTSYSMASRMLPFYRDLGDFELLITKMDEIEACGTLLNFSRLAEKPIACLTDSPFVSEQLRHPDVDAIINQILR